MVASSKIVIFCLRERDIPICNRPYEQINGIFNHAELSLINQGEIISKNCFPLNLGADQKCSKYYYRVKVQILPARQVV